MAGSSALGPVVPQRLLVGLGGWRRCRCSRRQLPVGIGTPAIAARRRVRGRRRRGRRRCRRPSRGRRPSRRRTRRRSRRSRRARSRRRPRRCGRVRPAGCRWRGRWRPGGGAPRALVVHCLPAFARTRPRFAPAEAGDAMRLMPTMAASARTISISLLHGASAGLRTKARPLITMVMLCPITRPDRHWIGPTQRQAAGDPRVRPQAGALRRAARAASTPCSSRRAAEEADLLVAGARARASRPAAT